MSNINSKTVIEYIYDQKLPFKGEKLDYITKETSGLLITPLKIMALLVAVSGLLAMIFEVRYFSEYALYVYFTRLIATLISFYILVSLFTKKGIERSVLNVHLLLFVIIISSGYMIYLMPGTLVVNAQIVGLMIFTSALFLSWEVKNQIIVAIYYNIVFASAILLNNKSIYFLPNMYESVIFILFLSLVSIVGSAVNFKLRMQLAENSFKIYLSEKKYRSIVNNSTEGIFQSSPEGRLLTVNDALCKILGYTTEELLNLDIGNDLFKNQEDRKTLLGILKDKGEVKHYEVTLKNKSGEDIVCSLNDHLMTDEDGNNTYFEGSLRDITTKVISDKKRLLVEKELREEKIKSDLLAKDALQSNEIKTQFIANMSHEIRTPMNGIIGFLNLIQKEAYKDDQELKQFAFNAKRSAESLLDILNDLLDLSKIESGKMDLECIDFNLNNLINDAVSIFSVKIKEKRLKVTHEIEKDIPVILNGASTRIRQVLANLIGNAIKFTDFGQIKIKVRRIFSNYDDLVLEFAIQDSGIGIPKQKIKELFQPFSQLDGSHTRKYGGSGLGLVICKQFVNMMGGDITVESEEGKGSIFYFTLHLKPQVEIISESGIISEPETITHDKPYQPEVIYQEEPKEISPVEVQEPIKVLTEEVLPEIAAPEVAAPEVISKEAEAVIEVVTPKEFISKEVVSEEAAPKEIVREVVTPKEVVPEVVVPKAFPPKEVAPKKVAPKEVTPKEIISKEAAPKEVVPEVVVPKEVVPKEVVSKEVPPKEVPPKKVLTEELLPKVIPTREISSEDLLLDDIYSSEIHSRAIRAKAVQAQEEKPVELPKKQTHSADIKKERASFKILLAEDNFINQKVALRILSEAGYVAEPVVNGQLALDSVKNSIPDLILMDVQMPEMDGFTATREIRNLGDVYKKIPIIAITAHALTGDRERCLESGMDDYVAKPIISEKLIALMDQWLNIRSVKVEEEQPDYEPAAVFDMKHLNKMSLNDLDFEKELITTYLQDLNTRSRKLELLLINNEYAKVAIEAHTIKGASLSVGAVSIGKKALQIEMMSKQEDKSGLPTLMESYLKAVDRTREILNKEFHLEDI